MRGRGPGRKRPVRDASPRASGREVDINELRQSVGMSLEQLAHEAGLSMSAVWNADHGYRKSHKRTIEKITAVLAAKRRHVAASAEPEDYRLVKCRWCGASIGALKYDPNRRQLVLADPLGRFTLKHGFFFHEDCLAERRRLNEAWPD